MVAPEVAVIFPSSETGVCESPVGLLAQRQPRSSKAGWTKSPNRSQTRALNTPGGVHTPNEGAAGAGLLAVRKPGQTGQRQAPSPGSSGSLECMWKEGQ